MQRKDESEKKSTEGRRFSKLATESIKNIAEVSGIAGLTEEIANRISDDVTYRLREVLHHTSIFLRQSKRRKLLTSDIREVLDDYDVSPIYGHSSSETPDFVFVNEAEVFVYDEGEESIHAIVFDSTPLIQLGDPVLKESKIPPTQGTTQMEPQTTVKMEPESVLRPANTEDVPNTVQLTPNLRSYYNRVTSVLLGCSKAHLEVIFSDFHCNNKIGMIVPFILNLLAMGLQKLPGLRTQFLQAALVLTQNKHIEFNSSLSVHRLVSALLMCALDTKERVEISQDEDYFIRSEAALVLGKVVSEWCQGESTLLLDIVQKLGSVLLNGSSSLKSHYGALVCLVSLGSDALEYCLWPHLAEYLSFLESQPQDRDVKEVEGAILNASENLYQLDWLAVLDPSTYPQGIMVMDQLLASYFGDALFTRRLCMQVITHEENYTEPGETFNRENSLLKPSDYRNWTGSKKPRSLPILLWNENDDLVIWDAKQKHSSEKSDPRKIFDVPNSFKHGMVAIEMNFAGGKPVPLEQLVRRRLDTNHSQLTVHSPFFKCCGEIRFTGPQFKTPPRNYKKQLHPLYYSNVGDILAVM